MPAGDGTGPDGMGPMTGRNMGYCAGFNNPGFTKPGRGAGFGNRRGGRPRFGRRNRRRVTYVPVNNNPNNPNFNNNQGYAPVNRQPSREEELNYLENTAEDLKSKLNTVMERIDELKKEAENEQNNE